MAKQDDKTEQPTPRRRREARSEGQIPRSTEVGVAFSLIGTLLVAQAFLPSGMRTFRERTVQMWSATDGGHLPTGLLRESVTEMVVGILAPFLLMALVAGLAAGFGQVGFTLARKAAKPKLKYLKRGLQRYKPSTALWELVRTVLKLGLLVAILWQPMVEWVDTLGGHRSLDQGLERTVGQAVAIVWRAALLAALIAAADYTYQRWKTNRDLKMSRQDVKREHKEQEGDPQLKSRRRRLAQEYSRNRMIRDVATADVVVTNPTHLAVALAYDPGDPAPRVMAKGADKLAERIRKEAYRNGVLVTEDKPLARELYRRVKVGKQIPAALYEAVAVVLALAYRRRGAGLGRERVRT